MKQSCFLFALAGFALVTLRAQEAPLETAEGLLQAGKFAEAAKVLETAPPDPAQDASRVCLLRALALHGAGQPAAAIAACDGVKPDSPWYHQALLLKAKCLAAQNHHQQAGEIFAAEAKRIFDTARKDRLAASLIGFADELLADATDVSPAAATKREHAAAILRRALDADLGATLRQDVFLKLATTLRQAGDYRGSIGICRQYLAQYDPDWLGERDAPQRLLGRKNARAVPGPQRHQLRLLLVGNLLRTGEAAAALFFATELLGHVKATPLDVSAADVEWEICRCLGPSLVAPLVRDPRRAAAQQAPAQGDFVLPPPDATNISNNATTGNGNGAINRNNIDSILNNPLPQAAGAINRNSIDAILNNPLRSHRGDPRFVPTLRAFLAAHPTHARAAEAGLTLALALQYSNQPDEALAAYRDFLGGQWPSPAPDDVLGDVRSPEARLQDWRQEAAFQIGRILYDQRNPAAAIDQWRAYTDQYPNGRLWEQAQSGIIDAEFMLGIQAVEAGDEALARRRMEEFLAAHPLDSRSRRILFIFGMFPYAEALRLTEEKAAATATAPLFEKAIKEWERLISKYPQSEESSLALYNTGVILADHLGQLEKAVEVFKGITWGQWAQTAKERVIILADKSLAAATERTWRTTEPARLKLSVRNLEKLTLSQYTLSLEAFFRSKHTLHNDGIEALDIDLIQPDKTWEIQVPGYAKYRSITHDLEVPFPAGKPGVCLVKTEGDTWRTTSLVIRSDIDIIVEAAQREALVYVENRLTGQPAANAFVLCSNGKEIISEGHTDAEGIYRLAGQMIRDAAKLCVYVRAEAGEAMQQLDLSGMTASMRDPEADDEREPGLSPRGLLWTERPFYQPGETLNCAGVIRDEENGAYTIHPDRVYQLSVLGDRSRPLAHATVHLDAQGCFQHRLTLPAATPAGEYRVVVRSEDGKESYAAAFTVGTLAADAIRLAVQFARPLHYPGDPISGRVLATFPSGSPVAGEPVTFELAGIAILTGTTDGQGACPFEFNPGAGVGPGSLRVTLPAREAKRTVAVPRASRSLVVTWDRPPALILPNTPVELTAKCRDPLGAPVAQRFAVTIHQTTAPVSNRVLEAVPWLNYSPPNVPTVVATQAVAANAKGELSVPLNLPKGGSYRLTLIGTDPHGEAIRLEQAFTVVDESMPRKLYLSTATPAATDTVPVGDKLQLKAYSFLPAQRALLTVAGQTFIHHRFIELAKGDNPVEIEIPDACWPNCTVQLAFLHERSLVSASLELEVTRKLNIALTTEPPNPAPGGTAKVKITTTGPTGQPVAATLDLALVNSALLRQFPDPERGVPSHFAIGVRQTSPLRVAGNAGFSHVAQSRRVAAAVTEVAVEVADANLNDQVRLGRLLDQELSYNTGNLSQARQTATFRILNEFLTRDTEGEESQSAGDPFAANPSLEYRSNGQAVLTGVFAQNGNFNYDWEPPDPEIRADLLDEPATTASVWHCPVTTAADGTATVELTVPATPGAWRLSANGVAADHLFGGKTITLTVGGELSLTPQFPASLRQGDVWQPALTLHHTGAATAAELTLTLDGTAAPITQHLALPAAGNVRAILPAQTVTSLQPIAGRVAVRTTDGRQTEISFRIPVEPFADTGLGTGGTRLTQEGVLALFLPGGTALTLSLHATALDALLAMALPEHFTAGAEQPQLGQALLAAIAAHRAAPEVKASAATLASLAVRIDQLIGLLQLTQTAGGWTWQGIRDLPDSVSTCAAYWALVEAKAAGFAVHQATLDEAGDFLTRCLAIVSPEDPEKAAIILHALALNGKADFSIVNRLHRDRESLNEPALAYLAAALVHMGREAMAAELLEALIRKAAPAGDTALWPGSKRVARLSDPAETTALTLALLAKLKPGSPLAIRAKSWLLASSGVCPWDRHRCAGVIIHSLAQTAGDVPSEFRPKPDDQVTLTLNDQPLVTLTRAELGSGRFIEVKSELLKPGANVVRCTTLGLPVWVGATALSHPPFAESKSLPLTLKPRRITRDAILYKNQRLKVFNDTQVKHAACGQVLRVALQAVSDQPYERYLILDEAIPAGCTLLRESITGTHAKVEVRGDRLRFHFRPRSAVRVAYQLLATAPGTYQIPPAMLSDAYDASRRLMAGPQTLTILPPNVANPDPLELNPAELFALASHAFSDDDFSTAEGHLKALLARGNVAKPYEKDLARMMLWIQTAKPEMEAASVVAHFETLSERHPDLVIPFDKILRVAEAYGRIGEFERSWLVDQAAINGSFLRDAAIASELEDQGDFAGSLAFIRSLMAEYPDSPDLREAHFTLAQSLAEKAPDAAKIPVRKGQPQLKTADLLDQSRASFESYLTLYATDARADDAAFGLINVFFSTKDYPRMIRRAEAAIATWPRGELANTFHYLAALGHFWQAEFDQALAAAAVVANSDNKDRDYARYITAQIHHARHQPAAALEWYQKVREIYPDARESILAFEEKKIQLPEVSSFAPGAPVTLDLKYRNIRAAALQIYKVDLMKLYLREKNLSNITAVDLAGINPQSETTVALGDGRDYAWKEKSMPLPLQDTGAYLVICRGDDLFTSALVLISPLKLDVREDHDSGGVRVSVTETDGGAYVTSAEVKAIGTGDDAIQAGTTDPRGAFQADGLHGRATVIVRHQQQHYAIFRGQTDLGEEPPELPNSVPSDGNADPFASREMIRRLSGQPAAKKMLDKEAYLLNIDADNKAIQQQSKSNWRDKLEKSSKGVKVKEAMEGKK